MDLGQWMGYYRQVRRGSSLWFLQYTLQLIARIVITVHLSLHCADGLPRTITWRNQQTMVQLRLSKLSLQVRPTFAILSISKSGIFSRKRNVRFESVAQLFSFSITRSLSGGTSSECYHKVA